METVKLPQYSKHALSMITDAVKRNKLMDSIPEETTIYPGVLSVPFFNDHSIAIPSVVLVGNNGRLYFFAMKAILTNEELEILDTLTEE